MYVTVGRIAIASACGRDEDLDTTLFRSRVTQCHGNLDKTEKFDDNLIITETLNDIRDGNQTHPNIDKREARLKIRDRIKQKKLERKGELRATCNMGKGLHKVFSTIVSEIRRN